MKSAVSQIRNGCKNIDLTVLFLFGLVTANLTLMDGPDLLEHLFGTWWSGEFKCSQCCHLNSFLLAVSVNSTRKCNRCMRDHLRHRLGDRTRFVKALLGAKFKNNFLEMLDEVGDFIGIM